MVEQREVVVVAGGSPLWRGRAEINLSQMIAINSIAWPTIFSRIDDLNKTMFVLSAEKEHIYQWLL